MTQTPGLSTRQGLEHSYQTMLRKGKENVLMVKTQEASAQIFFKK